MVALIIAVVALILTASAYVCLRRGRHGGLAGGDSNSVSLLPSDRTTKYSAEEVAKHSSAEDLWLVINGNVYNFTDYFALHPGGEAILRNAGKDSSLGFSGSQHPQRVWDMITEFQIGVLEDMSDGPYRELRNPADLKTD